MRMLPRLINQYFVQIGWILLIASGSLAQGLGLSEQDLADQLKFYKEIQELKTNFHQTKHLSEMKLDLKSDGHMTIKKPDDITWEILHPSPMLVKLSKNDVKITSGAEKQVFKFQDLSQDTMARGIGLLLPWLTLDAHSLSSQYKISKEADRQFLFEPKVEGASIRKMSLTLAKDGHLEKLKLFETSGDWMEIQFSAPLIVRKMQ